MKLLLLTDIPPNSVLTAGLVLQQLVEFMPKGSVCCFAAMNPYIDAGVSIEWLPTVLYDKPQEYGVSSPRLFDQIFSFAEEKWRQHSELRKLIKKAVAFGRDQKVTAVMVCLQGQSMIRMAIPVSRRLGVPLYTLVWDPVQWWLIGHDVNKWSRKEILRRFDKTVAASRGCATASWAMADEYTKKYGVFALPIIASHDRSIMQSPRPALHDPERVVIGMAGQFYAIDEWNKLLATLKLSNWKIAGRDVYLKVLGHYVPPADVPKGQLEFFGWKQQPEAVKILSEADLLYCPYPFSALFGEVSRLSFPSKVVLYLATGRAVVFHGPESSSPARYLKDKEAAFLITSNDESAIYNELHRAITQTEEYAKVAENGRQAFLSDFTLEKMSENFFKYLGSTYEEIEMSNSGVEPPQQQVALHRYYRKQAWLRHLPPTFLTRLKDALLRFPTRKPNKLLDEFLAAQQQIVVHQQTISEKTARIEILNAEIANLKDDRRSSGT